MCLVEKFKIPASEKINKHIRWKIVVTSESGGLWISCLRARFCSLYFAEGSKTIVLWMYDRKRGKGWEDKVVTESII